MSGITTHILDTAKGRPAVAVEVFLERRKGEGWQLLGKGVTDADGRNRELLQDPLLTGEHRLTFVTGPYLGEGAFFQTVEILFHVDDASGHYHVPLLLSPFGYTTYRGS